ncbi:leucine-rich repeat flightless-interacting protein 2-like isoform X5 [Amphibalanus amphitrite]|uniref:leucine-rich repeat flightless-interacting protein 2-like isoform X5 n=1 Tax=Amphibalanus amphitrite TaxID=1232801 RepID=UPI001C921E04|nr:leucine-rich repeat flightless-interacting protein 2-like isoform X5 [Amphibalanus amphitrite]
MVGRTSAASEPPSERRRSQERSEPAPPHAQLAMGALERLAPTVYVRNYRSLRRRIAEKTAPRPAAGRELPRPSYTPQQRAELRRIYSRSLSRPLPAPSRLGGSRGVTPSSESPRTRDATPSTPERQVRQPRPLVPLWTPADITVRDDPLDSEARLAARRQARAEAREIRMRELERQQREAEQNGEKLDDFSDVSPRPALSVASARAPRGPSAASSGRRASEDSAEDGTSTPSGSFHLRDVRHELRELEEKLRKTMVTSAQLDNDKSTLSYQVELLKDKLEEMQESHTQLQREHRTRCSEHEQLKRVSNRLKEDYECCKKLLEERDKLIAENGLVLVGDEEDSESESSPDTQRPQKALVSQNAAQLLEKAGGGTLDSRLRRLGEEKNELEDQLRRMKLELEEERHMSARARISGSGGGAESDQVQREVARQVGEYRFKLQKADQDITNLQTAVQRLENQVARYKAAAETAEKAEEELKGEKRKLQRELREAQQQVDELDSAKKTMERQQRLRRL